MVEVNNKTKYKINIKLIEAVAEKFLQFHKAGNKEVSIAFIGDEKIRQLNWQYRKMDKPTDVLAFPGEGNFFGEIIINYSQIKRQAKLYSGNTEKELVFILVHGLLHLLGYEDKLEKEKRLMLELGNKFIESKLITQPACRQAGTQMPDQK